jgi:uncharacterized protein (DUF305 family)
MRSWTGVRLPALLLTAALAMTACAGSDEESGDEGGSREQDVTFASNMIQHHAQALALVDLTVRRDLSPEVAGLAEAIREAQGPEIETMTDWLQEWGEEVPATVRDHLNAEGHGDDHAEGHDDPGDDLGAGMPGMVSEEDLAALEDAPEQEFEDLFLTLMIEHHEGAVTMAEEQVSAGEDPDAVALAEQIVAAQRAEIKEMQALLDS